MRATALRAAGLRVLEEDDDVFEEDDFLAGELRAFERLRKAVALFVVEDDEELRDDVDAFLAGDLRAVVAFFAVEELREVVAFLAGDLRAVVAFLAVEELREDVARDVVFLAALVREDVEEDFFAAGLRAVEDALRAPVLVAVAICMFSC